MSFSEISTYQVKPDKTTGFEETMEKAINMIKALEGCQSTRLIKRTHYIKEMNTIRDGLPPDAITRIVKCVRYALYSEFDTATNYGKAQKELYESYWKPIEKCLIVPHDKFLGEILM